jgi:peptidoglycan/xylan/chitin deacetylase (PgdA/CDA1 family)
VNLYRRRFLVGLSSSPFLFFLPATTKTLWGGEEQTSPFTMDQGAIIRGDLEKKQISLIFTGGEYGEGTEPILEDLSKLKLKAGLFVTGAFLADPQRKQMVARAFDDGHYVGPHSDKHPLYCSWENRDNSLISRKDFQEDLRKNISDLQLLGALHSGPIYLLPPYERFNSDQVKWAREIGVQLFSSSPGSGSNRDYLPESDPKFVSSQQIFKDILEYEKTAPHGLNGYILLIHLGADRKDKMFRFVEPLVILLRGKRYEFIRIDELISAPKK